MKTAKKIYLKLGIFIISLPGLIIGGYYFYSWYMIRDWKQLELTDSAERERSSYYKVTLNYPPEWTSKDVEYLTQNTDIPFKTGTEDYEVKLFIGTWGEPDGCNSFRQDIEYYDVMSCSSSTKEGVTIIEGEYYAKKDEKKFVYQKDIYIQNRSFEFRALATKYENLAFPRKVARFFNAERINVDQIPKSKKASNQ